MSKNEGKLPREEYLPKDNDHFVHCWWPSSAATSLWESNPAESFSMPHCPEVSLRYVALRNPVAADVVLVVPGFNEPFHKYIQVAYELFSAGFSVVVYDHRGQGLSDREPCLRAMGLEQNGYINNFMKSLVTDCVTMARLVAAPGHQRVHILAHSMGGKIVRFLLEEFK